MIILGLGSNLGDRLANLRQALKLLGEISELSLQQVAPVYESAALMPENTEPGWDIPYLNSAVSCTTSLAPLQLLDQLKAIEKKIGRPEHYERWSPRLIDIDILVWDDEIIENERLNVPQLNLCERPFAMWPLADLAPDWVYLHAEHGNQGKTAKEVVQSWGSRFSGDTLLQAKQIAHRIDGAQTVGALNISPDSFSDGGEFNSVDKAVQQAEQLFYAGADVIDIGAESTRPGGLSITHEQEWQRLEAILQAILAFWHDKKFKPKISVDTRRYQTAQRAIELGVDWINDVCGFSDANMCQVVKDAAVDLVFMHSLCVPVNPKMVIDQDKDVVATVCVWATNRVEKLLSYGIDKDRLIFDPGVGFGKTAAQSFTMIKRVAEFNQLKLPVLMGHSRKSFMKQFTPKPAHERDVETITMGCYLDQHADYVRVHNVDWYMRAKRIARAIGETGNNEQ